MRKRGGGGRGEKFNSDNLPYVFRNIERNLPPGGERFDTSKNASERIFNAKPQPVQKYSEMYFGGSPETAVESKYGTGWQTRNEWPFAYLGKNLIQTNRILWHMARLRNTNAWVNAIAPLVMSNNMNFTIQTKMYADDMADFIGVSGPVSEVATSLNQKTESVSYMGKGTSIHMNRLRHPEGARELWDKLMLVAAAINRTELYDFIFTIRRRTYAKAERYKCPSSNPQTFYETVKAEWDAGRKEHGLEELAETVVNLAQDWGGHLHHMILPTTAISKLIFRSEHKDYYKKGPSTTGLDGKIHRNVATKSGEQLDKADVFEKIKGFRVHLIRKLMSPKYDIYRDVISRFHQIGSFHTIYPKLDEGLTNPELFNHRCMAAKIYDEDRDKFRLIHYDMCAKHSLLFNKQGKIRSFKPIDAFGLDNDKRYDPFMKKSGLDEEDADYTEPIELIGEINVRRNDWPSNLNYVATTMNNHFSKNNIQLTKGEEMEFERMIEYLEHVPYSKTWEDDFKELNWRVMEVGGSGESHYSRGRNTFYTVKQKSGTGSYKLPERQIGWGLSSFWGIEAISSMDTKKITSDDEKEIVLIARKFVKYFNLHTLSLMKQLPNNEILNSYRKYSPSVFSSPKPTYNLWVNGVNNTTNWVWLKWNVFADVELGNDITDKVGKFINTVKNDSSSSIDVRGVKNTITSFNRLAEGMDNDRINIDNYIDRGVKIDDSKSKLLNQLKTHGYINPKYRNDVDREIATAFGKQTGSEKVDQSTLFATVHEAMVNPRGGIKNPFFPLLLHVRESYALGNALNVDPTQFANLPPSEFAKKMLEKAGTTVSSEAKRVLVGQYKMHVNKTAKHFNIYHNARQTANALNQVNTTDTKVQTTLVLNNRLMTSIQQEGRFKEVNQTRYENNEGILDEVADTIVEHEADDYRKYNSSNCMMTQTTEFAFWPYHIWRGIVHRKSADGGNINDSKFSTLAFKNIAKLVGGNYGGRLVSVLSECLSDLSGMFARLNLIMLLLSDCTRNNMTGLVHGGSCPPIVYLLARPHMEYKTHPVIFVGANSLFRVRGNPLFMMGLNPQTGILRFRYAQSGGTIPVNDENIYVHENAFVVEAMGGAGTEFYDPNEFEKQDGGAQYYSPTNNRFGRHNECSLFAIEMPLGEWNTIKGNIDLTGHHVLLLRSGKMDSDSILNTPPLFSTAYRFVNFWKIEVGDSIHGGRFEPPNTWVSQGRTLYVDQDGKYTDEIASQTHWGNKATAPGAKKYRSGRTATLDTGFTM